MKLCPGDFYRVKEYQDNGRDFVKFIDFTKVTYLYRPNENKLILGILQL